MLTHDFSAMDGAVQSRQMDALSAPHRSHLIYTARMAEREREPIPLPALQVSSVVFRLFNVFTRSPSRRTKAHTAARKRAFHLPQRVSCALHPEAC
jgi:hypothetical protein